jgi:FkbM family methyltransferase
MAVQIANIVNGVLARYTQKRQKRRFPKISWIKEKKLKHEEDKRVKTTNFGQLVLTYKRPYELLHTYKELFEEEIYNFIAETSSPFIIDCGANIGLSVLYFKSLYPNATVLAFEPDADNFALLKKNVASNKLSGVECRKSAVWVHNEFISFSSDGTQGSSITREMNVNATKIKAERLADIIQGKEIDFLKIDIEGAELEVLKDCEPFLENVKNLFVEYHGKTSDSEKLYQLIQTIKSHYKLYIKLAADNLAFPFVTKTTKGSFDVQLNIFCFK